MTQKPPEPAQFESGPPGESQQPTVPPSRRGRKPTGDRALTRAEIQRNYRRAKEDWKYQGTRHIPENSRVQLMERLSAALGTMEAIEDPNDDDRQGAQFIAEKVLGELVKRFQLRVRK